MTDTTTVTTTAVATPFTILGMTVDQWLSNARSFLKIASGVLVTLGVTDAVSADTLVNDLITVVGTGSGLIGLIWSMLHHAAPTTVTVATTKT